MSHPASQKWNIFFKKKKYMERPALSSMRAPGDCFYKGSFAAHRRDLKHFCAKIDRFMLFQIVLDHLFLNKENFFFSYNSVFESSTR